MFCWSELHPYDAIDVLEIAGTGDVDRLSQAAAATLEGLGISAVSRDGIRSYSLSGGPSRSPVARLSGDDLDWVLTQAMNQREEADPGAFPLRLLLVEDSQRHWILFRYQHWAVDGYLMALITHSIISGYLGVERQPFTLGQESRTFRPAVAARITGALGALRELVQMRRCHAAPSSEDPAVKVSASGLIPVVFTALRSEAERRDVSVSDLLLACLAEATSVMTPGRLQHLRRRGLSLIAVADLRRADPVRLQNNAGVHLAFFTTLFGEETDFEHLVQIARLARRQQKERGYTRAAFQLWLADRIWPWVRRDQRGRYLARQFVVAAGLTNFTVPFPARELRERGLAAWRRVVPTGPIPPMAIAATTVGDEVRLTLTWKVSVFGPGEIQAFVRAWNRRMALLLAPLS
jgi:hypothetical protein